MKSVTDGVPTSGGTAAADVCIPSRAYTRTSRDCTPPYLPRNRPICADLLRVCFAFRILILCIFSRAIFAKYSSNLRLFTPLCALVRATLRSFFRFHWLLSATRSARSCVLFCPTMGNSQSTAGKLCNSQSSQSISCSAISLSPECCIITYVYPLLTLKYLFLFSICTCRQQ